MKVERIERLYYVGKRSETISVVPSPGQRLVVESLVISQVEVDGESLTKVELKGFLEDVS